MKNRKRLLSAHALLHCLNRMLTRSVLAICLVLSPGAPGCERGPNFWEEGIDVNGDGVVTRAEWQAVYGVTNIHSNTNPLFDQSDCDQNGRITRRDLERGVSGHACAGQTNGLLSLAGQQTGYVTSIFPLPLSSEQLSALATATAFSYDEIYLLDLKQLPAAISEQNLTPSHLMEVHFLCLPVTETVIPFQAGPFLNARYPSITCDITNSMKDTAITLAVIRVEATYPDGPEVTLHAKALYLLPDAEERFTILLPPDTDQQSVQLQTVRGMPADDAGKIRRWFDFF